MYEAAGGVVLLNATEIEDEEIAVVPLMLGVGKPARLTVSVEELNTRLEYVSLVKKDPRFHQSAAEAYSRGLLRL